MNKEKIQDTIQTIKEIDGGKILAVGGKLLESIDVKKVKKAVKGFTAEGPKMDAVKGKIRLAGDILTWPVNYVEGLIGAIKNR